MTELLIALGDIPGLEFAAATEYDIRVLAPNGFQMTVNKHITSGMYTVRWSPQKKGHRYPTSVSRVVVGSVRCLGVAAVRDEFWKVASMPTVEQVLENALYGRRLASRA